MKFRIFLKSFENELIDFASQQLYRTLVQNEAKVKGIVSLPIRIKRFCVLRSPLQRSSIFYFKLNYHQVFPVHYEFYLSRSLIKRNATRISIQTGKFPSLNETNPKI